MPVNPLLSYFSSLWSVKTYSNLLYLLLSFPLGLAYFIILAVGFSLGIPLVILWVGLIILALMFAFSWVLTAFERQQAMLLLKVDIPPMTRPQVETLGFWNRLGAYFSNPVTWKGLLFLFLKLPIGLAMFVILVTVLATLAVFIGAPIAIEYGTISFGFWEPNTIYEGLVLTIIGILLLPGALHIFNWIAYGLGQFARLMLGQSYPAARVI